MVSLVVIDRIEMVEMSTTGNGTRFWRLDRGIRYFLEHKVVDPLRGLNGGGQVSPIYR